MQQQVYQRAVGETVRGVDGFVEPDKIVSEPKSDIAFVKNCVLLAIHSIIIAYCIIILSAMNCYTTFL